MMSSSHAQLIVHDRVVRLQQVAGEVKVDHGTREVEDDETLIEC